MLFNSIDFAIFLPVVFILYWFVTNRNLKAQNLLIVLASYLFYGWWDWRFLFLILFSTLVDYSIGLALAHNQDKRKRKLLLWVSILTNIGFLGYFKYYNFFLESFIDTFSFFGIALNANTLHIILPVGISFYTFQTLSYTIDVYKKKLEPTRDLIAFTAFVSFFPQLVAGPIERATHLLPQFYTKRKFDYANAINGMRQILWGLFKKIVIADNCAEYANIIFNNSEEYSGSTLLLGAIFFSFQIYCDFSGYSDIAIGTSRLFGFDLMKNFSFPYFSRNVGEFWRRWHISLSTWFRDYIYIPLGGSKGSTYTKIRNTFVIFIVSGFWHGANWTFVVWGALNALYFLPLLLRNKNRGYQEIVATGRLFPSLKEFVCIISTFLLTALTWVFFRAESIEHAIQYLSTIFSGSLFSSIHYQSQHHGDKALILIVIFVTIEWLGKSNEYAIEHLPFLKKRILRWVFYYALIVTIVLLGGNQQEFIYFQF